jgi:hypothetical protein
MDGSPPKKRFFPSIAAAIVVGAIWMPIFVLVHRLLEELPVGAWLHALWVIVGSTVISAPIVGDIGWLFGVKIYS